MRPTTKMEPMPKESNYLLISIIAFFVLSTAFTGCFTYNAEMEAAAKKPVQIACEVQMSGEFRIVPCHMKDTNLVSLDVAL